MRNRAMLFVALAVAASFLVGCEQSVSTEPSAAPDDAVYSQGSGDQQWWEYPDGIWLNYCGYDDLHVTGRRHRMLRFHQDASGGLHGVLNITFHYWAEGVNTGEKWRIDGHYQTEYVVHELQEQSKEENYLSKLTGFGDAPDFKIRFNFRYTVNANGELTSWNESQNEIDCH